MCYYCCSYVLLLYLLYYYCIDIIITTTCYYYIFIFIFIIIISVIIFFTFAIVSPPLSSSQSFRHLYLPFFRGKRDGDWRMGTGGGGCVLVVGGGSEGRGHEVHALLFTWQKPTQLTSEWTFGVKKSCCISQILTSGKYSKILGAPTFCWLLGHVTRALEGWAHYR